MEDKGDVFYNVQNKDWYKYVVVSIKSYFVYRIATRVYYILVESKCYVKPSKIFFKINLI